MMFKHSNVDLPRAAAPPSAPSPGRSYHPSSGGQSAPATVKDKASKSIMEMQKQLVALSSMIWKGFATIQENKFASFLFNKYSTMGRKDATKQGFDVPHYEVLRAEINKGKVDGNWDKITDDKLRVVIPFAYTLSSLAKKIGAKVPFSSGDFSAMQRLVPKSFEDTNGLSERDKILRAHRLIPLLAKMRQSMNEFIDTLIDASHQYTPHTLGKSFSVLPEDKTPTLTPEENKAASVLVSSNAPIPDMSFPYITFNDISSMQNLVSYLKTNNIQIDGQNAWEGPSVMKAIDKIRNEITVRANTLGGGKK
jgi:hypothetical protein